MMKRALMIASLFALAASPAVAYVQPSALVTRGGVSTARADGGAYKVPQMIEDDGRIGGGDLHIQPGPGTVVPATSQPVPEPGTMAMASMGLLALGATLRRRRGR